jgi:hypothetical protein
MACRGTALLFFTSLLRREKFEYKSWKFCVSTVLGFINQTFKPSLVSRHTRIRTYKTLSRPVLSYGSEAWTIRRTDERRLISAEMCFMRRTAGYTRWDHKGNEDILTELQMSQITEFLYGYRKSMLTGWALDRMPKMILKYQPKGKRNIGRPLNRWKDSVL